MSMSISERELRDCLIGAKTPIETKNYEDFHGVIRTKTKVGYTTAKRLASNGEAIALEDSDKQHSFVFPSDAEYIRPKRGEVFSYNVIAYFGFLWFATFANEYGVNLIPFAGDLIGDRFVSYEELKYGNAIYIERI